MIQTFEAATTATYEPQTAPCPTNVGALGFGAAGLGLNSWGAGALGFGGCWAWHWTIAKVITECRSLHCSKYLSRYDCEISAMISLGWPG